MDVCDFCLNYTSQGDEEELKTRDACSQACFEMDVNEEALICKNFSLVLCPDVSSAVIERFLKKDIDFYNHLCDLISMTLIMFSYQTIFKVIFDIEHSTVEFVDLTSSQSTYGLFKMKSIEIKENIVSFETEDELKDIIFSVVEPESIVFVEFSDFDHQYPIKGIFAKKNRFFNKNQISLFMTQYNI